MKTTGTTIEGNYIVEMTPLEHDALTRLAQATEGRELDYFPHLLERRIDFDLSSVVGAIYHFVTIKDNLNHVLNAAKEVDRLLMKSGEKSEGDRMVEFFKGDNDEKL